jgi:hypothetical protein
MLVWPLNLQPKEEAMRQTTRTGGLMLRGAIWVGVAAVFALSASALAQFPPRPVDPNQKQVYLVRLDQSNCTNSDVPNTDSPLVGGNVWVTRTTDGQTNVKVALTGKPSTKYHFFLKCVRLLSDIWTDDEGVANTSFSFPTNSAGNVYAFDMYPDGAPPGNKYQSAQVVFQ